MMHVLAYLVREVRPGSTLRTMVRKSIEPYGRRELKGADLRIDDESALCIRQLAENNLLLLRYRL